MIKLPSSALTQAVLDIKVCTTLVLTTGLLYFPLPAFAQWSPGINLKGGCRRWALGAHSGCRDKPYICPHLPMHTHTEAHTHIHIHRHTLTPVYTCACMYTQPAHMHEAHTRAHIHTHPHKHIFIYKWILSQVCTHMNISNKCAQTQIYRYFHT